MDLARAWATFCADFASGWPTAIQIASDAISNPWVRIVGLVLIVYVTIRVIAAVYSGDKQNAELGPVAIRPHASQRYGSDTVRLPHELMPMAMDGVSARCKIIYAYNDTRGRRRKVLVHTIHNARLSVSPVRLKPIKNVIYGQEIPDVESKYVCFPPTDRQEPADVLGPTPERALEYAEHYRILDNWTEDDTAAWISTSEEVQEQVAAGKKAFIESSVKKIKHGNRNGIARLLSGNRLYAHRPNAVGSYYLKFEFSHEPLFVLTRHPDRDLKTTAWLTVLTSMFALIMDSWPKQAPPPVFPAVLAEHVAAPDAAARVSRPVVTPP